MKKRYVSRKRPQFFASKSMPRVLSALFLLCLLIRAVSAPLQERADELSKNLDGSGAAETLLRIELGDMKKSAGSPALTALRLSTGFPYVPYETEDKTSDDTEGASEASSPAQEPPSAKSDTPPETKPEAQNIPDVPDAVETTITGEGGEYQAAAEGIFLKNKTDYNIDVSELLSSELSLDTAGKVLIIHTHGSEAYTPDGGDIYVPSDPSRTEDVRFSVVRVGDELEKTLTARGITVVHDRELYDYPSYNGAYNRSLEAIRSYQEKYPDISVVIDLHRDALESSDGTVYKTVADIADTPCAQVMLIVGTDFSGLEHPKWRENLKFALRLQAEMVLKYPTLARPLSVSQYRYNQHATTGSLIAEVGCNGNTLQEALCAVRYFGECLANVLDGEK